MVLSLSFPMILAKKCHFGCPLGSIWAFKDLKEIGPLITLAEGGKYMGWQFMGRRSPQKVLKMQLEEPSILGPFWIPLARNLKIWISWLPKEDQWEPNNHLRTCQRQVSVVDALLMMKAYAAPGSISRMYKKLCMRVK